MMSQSAMFPKPTPQAVELSGRYDNKEYWYVPGSKIAWRKFKSRRPPACDECTALQHFTGGKFGPRRNAKWCRTVKRFMANSDVSETVHLYVCDMHATLWRARDVDMRDEEKRAKRALGGR